MTRPAWISIAFALIITACGGGATQQPTVGPPDSSSVAEAAAVIGDTTPTSLPNGIAIPNVSLTLADGSALDFAEVDTPMLLVFWAEW